MKDPDFKLMVIKSTDALKHYEEQLKTKLSTLEGNEKDENKVSQAVSKVILMIVTLL